MSENTGNVIRLERVCDELKSALRADNAAACELAIAELDGVIESLKQREIEINKMFNQRFINLGAYPQEGIALLDEFLTLIEYTCGRVLDVGKRVRIDGPSARSWKQACAQIRKTLNAAPVDAKYVTMDTIEVPRPLMESWLSIMQSTTGMSDEIRTLLKLSMSPKKPA